MDYDELYRKVLELFPRAQMGEDNDGQLVIYTDMMVVTSEHNASVCEGDCIVVDFKPPEDE